jgi:hypothetical protein
VELADGGGPALDLDLSISIGSLISSEIVGCLDCVRPVREGPSLSGQVGGEGCIWRMWCFIPLLDENALLHSLHLKLTTFFMDRRLYPLKRSVTTPSSSVTSASLAASASSAPQSAACSPVASFIWTASVLACEAASCTCSGRAGGGGAARETASLSSSVMP